MASTRKVRYSTLNNALAIVGAEVALIDKSVFFWAKATTEYGFVQSARVGFIADSEKWITDANQDFGTDTKRNAVWLLISHLGDLLISADDSFNILLVWGLRNEQRSKVFEGNGAIYSDMGLKRCLMNLPTVEGIPNGGRTFTG